MPKNKSLFFLVLVFFIFTTACSKNDNDAPNKNDKIIEKVKKSDFYIDLQAANTGRILSNKQAQSLQKKLLPGQSRNKGRNKPEDKAQSQNRKPGKKPNKNTARLYVTLSCMIGNVPGYRSQTIPIDALVLAADKKYMDAASKKMLANPDADFDDIILQENIGTDGFIAIDLLGRDKAVFAVVPMDKRFNSANIMNDEWNKILLEAGRATHKNFIMSQAFCDEKNGLPVRGLVPQSYAIQYSSFSPDYDSASRAQIHLTELMLYGRMAANGAFELVKAPEIFDADNLEIRLKQVYRPMVINNIQTEHRQKRVCGEEKYSYDLTTRTDAALGIKTIEGVLAGDPMQCKEAWITKFPFTYDPDMRFEKRQARNKTLRYIEDGIKLRSTCNMDKIAEAMSGPVNYPTGCLESDIYYTTVFAADKRPPFLWGMPYEFATRSDITKWEEIKGKVPPTILP